MKSHVAWSDIRAEHVLQSIFAVAGEREPADVFVPGGAELAEQRLGILDGIALGQRVATEEQIALGRQDASCSSRARVRRRSDSSKYARAAASSPTSCRTWESV